MKILIVGAGVGGCALAGFIHKYNIGEVTVVERTRELGNMGYLIGLWGNGRKILRELGVESEIEKRGEEISLIRFENQRGKPLKIVSFDSFRKLSSIVITRADLQEGLRGTLGKNIKIKLKTTVTKIVQGSDGVRVELSDSTSDTFDLVVGADGINSSVRELVFGSGFKKYYGSGIWAYWLPENFNRRQEPVQASWNGRTYAISPIRKHAIIWFMATLTPGEVKSPEESKKKLYELFSDSNDQLQEALEAMPNTKDIFFDDMAYIDMPLWHKGRVVLIGDAKHAMSPSLGMGASLALEDAYVLAQELQKNGDSGIDSILAKYTQRRQKRLDAMSRLEKTFGTSPKKGKTSVLGKFRNILLPLIPAYFILQPLKKFVGAEI